MERKLGPEKYVDMAFKSMAKLLGDAAHFRVGANEKVPLKEIVLVVARAADAGRWPAFGSASPASLADVERAAKAVGFRVARLERVRWRGREKTGLFALGVDVAERERDRPSSAAPEETTTATAFECACGYESLDSGAARKHAARCDEAAKRLPKARLRRCEDGRLEARFYACANADCKFGRSGRIWLSRQAAYAHRKAHGCLITSDRAKFKIVR